MSIRVLITGARAPSALHLARILNSVGHAVILADSQHFPVGRATRCKQSYLRLPAAADGLQSYGRAVEAVVRNENCDLVLPTCEEIFHLAAWRDLLGGDIPLFAPPFELLKTVHDKYEFTRLSAGCGADAAQTHLLKNRADVERFVGLADRLVFKPVWSRFASRVFVRPDREALNKIVPTPNDPWVVQDYLPGDEFCCWGVAHAGHLKALSSYQPLYRINNGAAIAFNPVDEPTISLFMANLVRKTRWTGQIACDFRRDAEGKLHVLECNPRTTSGVHLFGPHSGLEKAILGHGAAHPDQAEAMTLPLAMVAYGLPQSVRKDGWNGFDKWRRDFQAMDDLLAWRGDRGTTPMQLLGLGEIVVRSVLRRQSLSEASTVDIEWNGDDLSPGAGCV